MLRLQIDLIYLFFDMNLIDETWDASGLYSVWITPGGGGWGGGGKTDEFPILFGTKKMKRLKNWISDMGM